MVKLKSVEENCLDKKYESLFDCLNDYRRIGTFFDIVEGCSISDISRKQKQTLCTIYSHVNKMKDRGLIEKEDSGSYRPTPLGSYVIQILSPKSKLSKDILEALEESNTKNIEKELRQLSKEDAKKLLDDMLKQYDDK